MQRCSPGLQTRGFLRRVEVSSLDSQSVNCRKGRLTASLKCPVLLKVILHRAVRERELLKAHDGGSVPCSIPKNSNDVACLERIFVPTAYADQHARTPRFAGPFFDLAFVGLYVHGNQSVW